MQGLLVTPPLSAPSWLAPDGHPQLVQEMLETLGRGARRARPSLGARQRGRQQRGRGRARRPRAGAWAGAGPRLAGLEVVGV